SGNLADIPACPGVYVFARRFGKTAVPIYIGKALNLQARIKTHLNSISLMKAIFEAKNGDKIIMLCVPEQGRNQNPNSVITVMEDALIEHAMHEGFDILNKKGTKYPTHTIKFLGNRLSQNIAPATMKVK